ncbi:MAG: Nudix family hydrolase [Pelistega sp.]|nr:Nudix family hydrolase [Pelistega sp.]
MEQKPFIRVAVGVVINSAGQVLLAQRPEDKAWAGWWEFPGGKIEDGESVHQALARELKEELDIEITSSTPWVHFTYEYPKTVVELSFCRVYDWKGEVHGLEKQAFAWTDPTKAHELGEVLPASVEPLKWLALPESYAISHFQNADHQDEYWQKFEQLLAQGVRLFQFREPNWSEGVGHSSLKTLFEKMLAKCHEHGAKLLINSAHPRAWWALADGVQLRAQDAVQLDERPIPSDKLMGVSCHHLADILYANHLQADFMVLGHVEATPSHPNEAPLGWEQFQQFAQEAGRPVFPIGGQSLTKLPQARKYGAHGIAFIRG